MAKHSKSKTKVQKPSKAKRKGKPLFGPLHPWRKCPIGQHWVRAHEREESRVPISGYCRTNRSHKEQLYPGEMDRIASEFFLELTGPPKADALGNRRGNNYDTLIRGWTKYWNEIFQPADPLNPNLVKALIASESSFKPLQGKGKKAAKGLMQLTDQTRNILEDENGELENHLINLAENDAYDPNSNIAAGIRWLFHKKYLASKRLKREASWEEAVAEYKDLLRRFKMKHRQKRAKELFRRFEAFYIRLKKDEP